MTQDGTRVPSAGWGPDPEDAKFISEIAAKLQELQRAKIRGPFRILLHPEDIRQVTSLFDVVIVRSSIVARHSGYVMVEPDFGIRVHVNQTGG